MKTKFFAFLLFLAFATSFSQDMQSLKTQTEKMYAASYAIDLNTIMDLTYPKVFEIVDRPTLQNAMESVFKNEMMTISFANKNPVFNYSDIKTIEGKKFNIIRYTISMNMAMKQKPDPEMARGMVDGMKGNGKYHTVTYDEATGVFHIEGDSVLIAVADDSTKNQWTFVNYDNEELFQMVFNESIKKQLGL